MNVKELEAATSIVPSNRPPPRDWPFAAVAAARTRCAPPRQSGLAEPGSNQSTPVGPPYLTLNWKEDGRREGVHRSSLDPLERQGESLGLHGEAVC